MAENPVMEAFFSWVGAALGALFAVAVLVAWWEHLVRNTRHPAAPPETPPPRAVTVDVPLDTLTAPPPGDTAERQAALDGALQRMASPAPAAAPGAEASAWVETEPMVLSAATAPAAEAKAVSPP
ncbi:hypothetical protein [Rubrivivax rivuli]|uniref:Uncharacterized protein n=1 Tax=Rubrivivax rivuli TaxID=1862385 RepID=A0A437RCP6_9BURK|nr:hypothetical protein [Rubrivivax rivuli]RVU44464.1 hypothetical protein EOE66_17515 [Rubrivivax rivuli]